MTDKKLYPYEIPDSFFLPHKVIRKFYARVVYKMVDGKPVIEEVGLSPKCLSFINNTSGMMVMIEGKLNEIVEKANRNSHVDETVINAIANYLAAPLK